MHFGVLSLVFHHFSRFKFLSSVNFTFRIFEIQQKLNFLRPGRTIDNVDENARPSAGGRRGARVSRIRRARAKKTMK